MPRAKSKRLNRHRQNEPKSFQQPILRISSKKFRPLKKSKTKKLPQTNHQQSFTMQTNFCKYIWLCMTRWIAAELLIFLQWSESDLGRWSQTIIPSKFHSIEENVRRLWAARGQSKFRCCFERISVPIFFHGIYYRMQRWRRPTTIVRWTWCRCSKRIRFKQCLKCCTVNSSTQI